MSTDNKPRVGDRSLIRKTEEQHTVGSHFGLYHHEISVPVFQEAWFSTGIRVSAFHEQFVDAAHMQARIEQLAEEPGLATIGDLDVPYLQLKSYQTGMLNKAYLMLGDRYLLTPASRKDGLRRVAAEEDQLNAGSHLFEACDMHYVHSRHVMLAELRLMLT